MAKREDLSLYDELKLKGFEACIIATYNMDFAFYERVLLRRLQSVGCRHNVVLMDAAQCGKELAIESRAPHFAGADYALLPIKAGGAFHPKFIFLIGRKKARLIVGSHNVSVPGFGLSREVTTALDIEPEGSTSAAGRAIWGFVRAWTADLPPDIQKVVAATDRIAPWLTAAVASFAEHPLLMTVPDGKSLWEQLRSRLKSKVARVFVVSPYFDLSCSFLRTIDKEVNPKELVVALQPMHSLISQKARSLVPRARFVDVTGLGDWGDRRLHAKILKFEFQNGESLVVTGSANASAPAWLSIGNDGNAEVVIVHENGNQVWRDLGLDKLGKLAVLSDGDWKAIGDRAALEPDDSETPIGQAPTFAVATSEGFVVSAGFAKGLTAADIYIVAGGDLVGKAEALRTAAKGILVVCSDPKVFDRATLLKGRTKRGPDRIAVIHRVRSLLDRAAGTTHQAFRRALTGLEGDPEHLSQLIQIVEKAIFDTTVSLQEVQEAAGRVSGRQKAKPADIEHTSLMVSAKDTIKGRRRRRVSVATDLALIIDALIYRLGQGLQHEDTDSPASVRAGEPGADEEEDERREEPDGYALAKLCRGKVNRLFRRMAQQMEGAVTRGNGATTAVVQLAAVLGVVKHLRLSERSLSWLPRGETLVDVGHAWEFFMDASRLLHAPTCNLASMAIEESAELEFDELTICRALLAWIALDCELDTRTAVAAAEDQEEVRDNLIGIAYFLPVILACKRDDQADAMLRSVAAEQKSREEPVLYHLQWAESVERAAASNRRPAEDLKRGSIAIPLKMASPHLSVVADIQHDKAGIVDLDTGEVKFFKSGYLGRVL
ncbi:MAG TPA: hypothetical protein VNJ04_09460 [Gemmatimonadaceae bacterium]|nr:hypothetical protein [Gemmatimonadaceae bacterium]